MEKKPNTTCKICGKRYYHCKDCERINSWRLVACSPECWNKWCDLIEARQAEQKKKAEPKSVKKRMPVIKEDVTVINEESVSENIEAEV